MEETRFTAVETLTLVLREFRKILKTDRINESNWQIWQNKIIIHYDKRKNKPCPQNFLSKPYFSLIKNNVEKVKKQNRKAEEYGSKNDTIFRRMLDVRLLQIYVENISR